MEPPLFLPLTVSGLGEKGDEGRALSVLRPFQRTTEEKSPCVIDFPAVRKEGRGLKGCASSRLRRLILDTERKEKEGRPPFSICLPRRGKEGGGEGDRIVAFFSTHPSDQRREEEKREG